VRQRRHAQRHAVDTQGAPRTARGDANEVRRGSSAERIHFRRCSRGAHEVPTTVPTTVPRSVTPTRRHTPAQTPTKCDATQRRERHARTQRVSAVHRSAQCHDGTHTRSAERRGEWRGDAHAQRNTVTHAEVGRHSARGEHDRGERTPRQTKPGSRAEASAIGGQRRSNTPRHTR
jgi:hypothetical protein